MEIECIEECPHCGHENHWSGVGDDVWVKECAGCGKVIPLCDKCSSAHPDEAERPCADCIMCDTANYMNYLRGKVTVEEFLSSLEPPLTDMTSGLPEGARPTLDDYLGDAFGDDVMWDTKYWEIYRMVSECFLTKESGQNDFLQFVSEVVRRNRG